MLLAQLKPKSLESSEISFVTVSSPEAANWRSPDRAQNVQALAQQYPSAFAALAKIDAAGHRILTRVSNADPGEGINHLICVALLRRAVTAFVGIRELLEVSSAQPALIVMRSHFEVFLALRYLVHGGRRRLWMTTPSSVRMREQRARYFMASSIRTSVYRMQAMLDGKEGAARPHTQQARTAIRAELAAEIRKLEEHFPTQHRRFGAFRCFSPKRSDRRYFERKEWYSFGFRSGRVTTLRALATRFGYLPQYYLIYSPLSDLGHARGIDHDVTIADGHGEVHSPYDPIALAFIAFWSCHWQLLALVWAARAHVPDAHGDLQQIEQEVRPLLETIEEEASSFYLG